MKTPPTTLPELEQVAGNGLLHRRLFLTQSAALVGASLLTAQICVLLQP